MVLFPFDGMTRFNLKGIGPKKEEALVQGGYDTIDKLQSADFYDIMHLPGFGYNSTCTLWSLLGREIEYPSMFEVVESVPGNVTVENKVIKPWREYKKKQEFTEAPSDYKVQRTTVWSFPDRGDWASHTPQ